MKEIYRSFDVLSVEGPRTGYIVYQLENYYQVEWKSIEPDIQPRKFRIAQAIDWKDPGAVSEARQNVEAANIEGQAFYKNRWYSTKTILKIMKDKETFNWQAYC